MGAEFARRFPKVAGRLGLSELECTDPHVERLLQGYALLAGRVAARMDAEFPAVPRGLIERACPNLLAPMPSITIAQFNVDPTRRSLGSGFIVERDTPLRARTNGDASTCEFRTAHAVTLLPIELEAAEYTSVLHDIADVRIPTRQPIRALLRLKLRVHNNTFRNLRIDQLPIFIAGDDPISTKLYEQLIASATPILMRWGSGRVRAHALSNSFPAVRAVGFGDDHALLPRTTPQFRGYRLLQEYFAFPSRFDFVELTGLRSGMERCTHDRIEVLLPLTQFDPTLENAIGLSRLLLFATPAVNLFPRACARLSLRRSQDSFKLEPNRSSPEHYEVHTVARVWARGRDSAFDRELLPRYQLQTARDTSDWRYTLERRIRTANPAKYRRFDSSAYLASDVYLTLDGPSAHRTTAASNPRELVVHALCTNGSAPTRISLDHGGNDFVLQIGAPAESVRCVVAPSPTHATSIEGTFAWSLLSHLSLNYLSICGETNGVEAVREMLTLYAQLSGPTRTRQSDSLREVKSVQTIGPLPETNAHSFAQGLQVHLHFDEQALLGHRSFTLASVLSQLFARHAPQNSFTQTVLSTTQRGEVYQWPSQSGLRNIL